MLIPRHQRLLALLSERGHLTSGEVAGDFGVTPMTVWRDFRLLEELGLLRRVRGGVRSMGSVPGEPVFESKEKAAMERKRRIAAEAVRQFVQPGSVLALEGGTTVAAVLGFLPGSRISLITNSLPVAAQARNLRPQLPVRLLGGWLSPVSGNLTGPEAIRDCARLKADICFLSATGWQEGIGPMDPNPLEVEVKRALASIARKTVLLLDSGKFGLPSTSVALHPRRLHAVVTDAPPPPSIARHLAAEKVPLLVATVRSSAATSLPNPDLPQRFLSAK
jgi:DeoR family fructose operon transcriptional repressor